MTTIGNRYSEAIKRRVAELTKAKDKGLPKLRDALTNKEALLTAAIAAGFKLPDAVDVRVVNYGGLGRYDDSSVEINGVSVNVNGRQLAALKGIPKAAKAMTAASAKLCESKKAFCNEHELLARMQDSSRINAFKAFARARMDKDDNVKGMSDAAFKALVADFLETQREHVCPL